MLILFLEKWPKTIFKSDLKKIPFHKNVDIFGYMGKNDFFKMVSKNVIFSEMLIFDYWVFK